MPRPSVVPCRSTWDGLALRLCGAAAVALGFHAWRQLQRPRAGAAVSEEAAAAAQVGGRPSPPRCGACQPRACSVCRQLPAAPQVLYSAAFLCLPARSQPVLVCPLRASGAATVGGGAGTRDRGKDPQGGSSGSRASGTSGGSSVACLASRRGARSNKGFGGCCPDSSNGGIRLARAAQGTCGRRDVGRRSASSGSAAARAQAAIVAGRRVTTGSRGSSGSRT